MSNLKISGLVLVLAALIAATPSTAATIKNGKSACVTNISNVKNCRFTKPAKVTTKKTTNNNTGFFASLFGSPEPVAPPKKRVVSTSKKKVIEQQPIPKNVVVSPAGSVYTEAKRYVGLSERTHTKSIQNLTGVNPRRTPWCAAFVNAILNKMGYKGTNSLTAASFSSYGTRVYKPAKGDIVVVRTRSTASGKHVGIFVEYKIINGRKMVGVLGGNQNNMVKVTYYSAGNILTIRRPTT